VRSFPPNERDRLNEYRSHDSLSSRDEHSILGLLSSKILSALRIEHAKVVPTANNTARVKREELLHLRRAHIASIEIVGGWTGSPRFVESPILRIEPWHYFALLERFENLLQPRLTKSIVV
jgi:hypothetical protein